MRETENYSTSELCEVFGVSQSGYRYHHSEMMTLREVNQMKLIAEMKVIHADPEFKAYGSPRMTEELRSRNFTCSVNTVAKLMRLNGIVAQRDRI